MNFCTALRGWGLRREKGHFLKHVRFAMIPPHQCEGAAGFPFFSASKCYCRENTFSRGVNHSNISCTFLQNPKISRKSEIPEIQKKISKKTPWIPKNPEENSSKLKISTTIKIRKTIPTIDVNKIPEIEKISKKLHGNQKRKNFKTFKLLWHFKKWFPLWNIPKILKSPKYS